MRITQCDAWAHIAWLAADGLSDTEMGFVYRRKGDTEWLAVPDVEIEGGTFRAKLAGLDPETTYELRAFSDTDSCDMREFTTEAAPQLPNAGFETWSTDRSDILYPYAADAPLAEQFWGSGNPGSMTLKKLVTTNEKDPRPGSEGQYCAQLKSQYVAFLGVGKFAAGNLFSGHYAETKGTDGIVNFSQPFTSRPVALHGWVKYNRGKMDYIKSSPVGMSFAKGDPDEGIIYMALGRWTAAEYVDLTAEILRRLRPDIAVERIAGQTPPRIRCRRPWGNLRGDALWRMLEKRLVEKNAHQGEFFVSSQR